ncbi:NnrU family protein [Seohaeicola saemankumensis]|nr:NnrU family protein [Seohaeicola saemankumensis]MCA0869373.1 NnrU family protein [Seohaeicola saemankumensis]
MQGWFGFGAALLVFLLSHAIPVRPPVRPWLVARLGLRGYFAAYSLLSIAVLAWLIIAAANAPYVQVIPPWGALRWVPILAMAPVCLLVTGGMWGQNPLSFGGVGSRSFDPEHPGLLAVTRHPMLLALFIWSMAHLLANGDLAHVILFGLFAGFAWIGMALIDRRKRRDMGEDLWQEMARNTARLSLARVADLRGLTMPALAAIGMYALLILLHPLVIGVSPLP